jgi:hypothetical protein
MADDLFVILPSFILGRVAVEGGWELHARVALVAALPEGAAWYGEG